MKIKVKVAKVGEQIIDRHGYVYTVEGVYDQYVSVGQEKKVMHHDYTTIPNDPELKKDIEIIAAASMRIAKKAGDDFVADTFTRLLNRLTRMAGGELEPEWICAFEEFISFEEDSRYEYVRD
ncbi:MAG TPA: hypothetical protein VNM69_06655 [Bacillus sp. (in: firmicutes)]|nr:hypothetical protein [Bacillus sp. (in: firmicutes)]